MQGKIKYNRIAYIALVLILLLSRNSLSQETSSPTLEESLIWLESKINMAQGTVEKPGRTINYNVRLSWSNCNISIEIKILTKYDDSKENIFTLKYEFCLCDMNATTIEILPDKDPGSPDRIRIFTFRFDNKVKKTQSYVDEAGNYQEGTFPESGVLLYVRQDISQKVAKALKHSIGLCGGYTKEIWQSKEYELL